MGHRIKSITITLSISLCCLLLVGCKDPYGACEKAALNIGNGISAGMKATDDLRVAGKISVQEETNILGFLKFANDGNGTFASCAKQVHDSGAKTGYTVCANQLQTLLSDPKELALVHISNQNSQGEVMAIVEGLSGGVNTLLIALEGQ